MKKIIKYLILIFISIIITIIIINYYVILSTKNMIKESNMIKNADCIIILGAGLRDNYIKIMYHQKL